MYPIIASIIFLVVVLLITSVVKYFPIKKEEQTANLPYTKKPYLMTNAEREFFKVLHLAVQDKYYIVPQVQLSKIVEVKGKEKWHYEYKNKINLKSVDFVLFDKEYFTPQVVIELDDSSHEREDRKERDVFVDSVMEKISIRIVHIKTSYKYDVNNHIIANV